MSARSRIDDRLGPPWGAFGTTFRKWSAQAMRRAFAAAPDGAGDDADRRVMMRAGRTLGANLRELHETISREELDAFRNYLADVVSTVSLLLLRSCEQDGYDLDGLVRELRPRLA